MDSFNPTTKTQAALTASLQAATRYAGNPQITPAHLLMALLTQNDGITPPYWRPSASNPRQSGPRRNASSTSCPAPAARLRSRS